MEILKKLRDAAGRIKHDAITVYYVARSGDTPFPIRLLAFAIAAYAFSPIDLIPDFIPVLGLLDDLIILPLGIALVIKLAPTAVIESSRARAKEVAKDPTSNLAAVVIVAVWIFLAALLGHWFFNAFFPHGAPRTRVIEE